MIKTMQMSLSKVLTCKGGKLGKPRILLLALAGFAAININGTIIHSDLGINVRSKLYPLTKQHRAALEMRKVQIRKIG